MLRIIRRGIFCITSLIALVAVPLAAGQKTSAPVPGPIPAQILAARKIFISNGGSTAVTDPLNLTYDEFYAGMKSLGRFELVASPAEAELVFEISYSVQYVPSVPYIPEGKQGSPVDGQCRLVVLDPKTHITLWTFTEHVEKAFLTATWRRNMENALATLVIDVDTLTSQPPVASTPAAPTPKEADRHLW